MPPPLPSGAGPGSNPDWGGGLEDWAQPVTFEFAGAGGLGLLLGAQRPGSGRVDAQSGTFLVQCSEAGGPDGPSLSEFGGYFWKLL